jgi:hypothetical protein
MVASSVEHWGEKRADLKVAPLAGTRVETRVGHSAVWTVAMKAAR